MPKERFSDAELKVLARAADANKALMDAGLGYRDLFYGKWSLLTSDIERELLMRETERRTMFVSPAKQLENLAKWNAARGWGFSEDDIAHLGREIPAEPPPPEKGHLQLKARVLEINLPDVPDGTPGVRRTFDELWDIIVQEQGAWPCHLFGLSAAVRIELAAGATHRPGLRWRTIDLGYGWPEPDPSRRRFRGTPPRRLPPDAERPHAGILAAAAHFPLWLARMDGRLVPRVWLPGYDLPGAPHGLGPVSVRPLVQHPRITAKGERTFLYYGWDHMPFDDHAVPVYVDAAPPEERLGDGFGG